MRSAIFACCLLASAGFAASSGTGGTHCICGTWPNRTVTWEDSGGTPQSVLYSDEWTNRSSDGRRHCYSDAAGETSLNGGMIEVACYERCEKMFLESVQQKKDADKLEADLRSGKGGHAEPLGTRWPYFVLVMLFGTFVKTLEDLFPAMQGLYTVIVFSFGIILGILVEKDLLPASISESNQQWAKSNPNEILFGMLPPLVFESAFAVDPHVFAKIRSTALVMAFPGVILATTLTGFIARPLFGSDCWANGGKTWFPVWLFGSIVSATDPVAVVAVLKTLGAPSHLRHMIEGESLLNDGSAVVLFLICKDAITQKSFPTELDEMIVSSVWRFVVMAAGGALWGYVAALAVYQWLRVSRHTAVIDISVLMISVYLVFYFGEFSFMNLFGFHVSGVLAVVSFGVTLAKKKRFVMSHETLHANHAVWSQVCHYAETLIFNLSGTIVYDHYLNLPEGFLDVHLPLIIVWYVALHLIRGLTMLCLKPILGQLGYGLTSQEACIMVYGGLRGGVSLSMALMVDLDPGIPKDIKDVIFVHVAGCVALTLAINGMTCAWVYNKLDPSPENHYLKDLTRCGLVRLDAIVQHQMKSLTEDWFHFRCDQKTIQQILPAYNKMTIEHGEIISLRHQKSVEDVLFGKSPKGTNAEEQSYEERYIKGFSIMHASSDFAMAGDVMLKAAGRMHARHATTALSPVGEDEQLDDTSMHRRMGGSMHVGKQDWEKLTHANAIDSESSAEDAGRVMYELCFHALEAHYNSLFHHDILSMSGLAYLVESVKAGQDVLVSLRSGTKKNLQNRSKSSVFVDENDEEDNPIQLSWKVVEKWCVQKSTNGMKLSNYSQKITIDLLRCAENLFAIREAHKEIAELCEKGRWMDDSIPAIFEAKQKILREVNFVQKGAETMLADLHERHTNRMRLAHTTLAARTVMHHIGHELHTLAKDGFFDDGTLDSLRFHLEKRQLETEAAFTNIEWDYKLWHLMSGKRSVQKKVAPAEIEAEVATAPAAKDVFGGMSGSISPAPPVGTGGANYVNERSEAVERANTPSPPALEGVANAPAEAVAAP